MRISLLVAVATNGVIGRGGDLPWHLPADLKRFQRLTVGHTLIMGRKTYESIGRPLPRRHSLVITRDRGFVATGGGEATGPVAGTVAVVHSLAAALAAAAERGEDEAFVVGGAEIFALALERADRLYLTRVHAAVAGDVSFPAFDPGTWRRVAADHHPADRRHAHAFTFETWEPRRSHG